MAPLQARVKSVLSGDTLILANVNNPAQERTLSLAFVTAPRMRRGPSTGDTSDEPFAFESRDFLRRLCVGKVVQFSVLYKIPTGANREYGTVQLVDGNKLGLALPEAAVQDGWLKLRDDAGKREESEEGAALLEKLQALEARAKADSKGLWGQGARVENTAYELSDSKAFLEEWKGKSLEAIVEKVLSGDRLIARLITSPKSHTQTLLLIAGIRSPSTARTNTSDGSEQAAEPFGPDAQRFVEERLLQRSLTVTILGTSPNGQLVAAIKHPKQGSIAEFILKAGLARCVDHHSTMLGADMASLRAAERHAKDNKLGVFRSHVSAPRGGGNQVEAIVSRVMSADTVFIRNKAGNEKRITLSSVRQPKPSDPKQAPFQAEAKEFLRKRLIGKHVKVTIDGKRPATEGFEEREMATLSSNNKNVGLMMVEAGFASVIRHRMDDTDRSPIYDELLAAEEQAQKDQKGMWAAKPPAAKQYVDYSETLEKAKRQMALLSRQRKVPCVVDFVKSGSRFTILIARDNAKLTLVLSGIRAPRAPRNDGEGGDPFGKEALDFANRRCLQRDVEIDVEGNDKVGGFIGTLYVNRENFTKSLVEEGLASVHAYSAEKSGNATELFAAEKRAKEARKGMWHDWDPSQDAAAEEGYDDDGDGVNGAAANGDSSAADANAPPPAKDYRDVVVTHIEDTGRLKLQLIGQSTTSALTELMSSFRSFHLNPSNASKLPGPPKTGDLVASQFSEDKEWYRARVRRNDRENQKSEVVYIDYGNSETVPWNSLRPLSQAQFNTQKLKPQAVEAALAYVQLPNTPEYLGETVHYLFEMVTNKQLVANVDFTDTRDNGLLYVTLFDPKVSLEVKDNINAEIVAEGLAMVPRKLKAWERGNRDMVKLVEERQEQAKGEKRGMWEYGDLTED